MDEWDKFDHTVAAPSKVIIQLCFHAVAHPDDDEPYTVLKEDLLQQHTLTKYHRIERLLAVGPLGSHRPLQLLAEMMELCPDDEEATCFFVFFFLQQLPAWLRVQLECDNQDDIRRGGQRAGQRGGQQGRGSQGGQSGSQQQGEAGGKAMTPRDIVNKSTNGLG
jgi:hypothetical protein